MKSFVIAALAAVVSTAAVAEDMMMKPPAPMGSEGLYVLATTGWANLYAKETGGLAFDETGGMPGFFTYDVPVDLSAARALLGEGEFLAPHFHISTEDKSVTIMVAPHLLVDGKVVKGANPNKDNFIVISGAEAARYDYSEEVTQ